VHLNYFLATGAKPVLAFFPSMDAQNHTSHTDLSWGEPHKNQWF